MSVKKAKPSEMVWQRRKPEAFSVDELQHWREWIEKEWSNPKQGCEIEIGELYDLLGLALVGLGASSEVQNGTS